MITWYIMAFFEWLFQRISISGSNDVCMSLNCEAPHKRLSSILFALIIILSCNNKGIKQIKWRSTVRHNYGRLFWILNRLAQLVNAAIIQLVFITLNESQKNSYNKKQSLHVKPSTNEQFNDRFNTNNDVVTVRRLHDQ